MFTLYCGCDVCLCDKLLIDSIYKCLIVFTSWFLSHNFNKVANVNAAPLQHANLAYAIKPNGSRWKDNSRNWVSSGKFPPRPSTASSNYRSRRQTEFSCKYEASEESFTGPCQNGATDGLAVCYICDWPLLVKCTRCSFESVTKGRLVLVFGFAALLQCFPAEHPQVCVCVQPERGRAGWDGGQVPHLSSVSSNCRASLKLSTTACGTETHAVGLSIDTIWDNPGQSVGFNEQQKYTCWTFSSTSPLTKSMALWFTAFLCSDSPRQLPNISNKNPK